MSASNLTDKYDDRSSVPVGALRRFTRSRKPARLPLEHCELCSEVIPPDHCHLLNLSNRALVCACQACSSLFNEKGINGEKYRLVPRRYLVLPDFRMADEQWDSLMIPVNMVYIFRVASTQRAKAFYPSPAGAMESLLSLQSWEMLVSDNPLLEDMETEVEALLINRVGEAREYYIVPIDCCYELIGLIRTSWRGLSGGSEVWEAIAAFFANIRAKATL